MTSNLPDDEHELHIKTCGRLMEAAMAQGNRQEAMGWMQAQALAIAMRSPARIARMTAAIDRTIDEGVIFFDATGVLHGAAMRQEAIQ